VKYLIIDDNKNMRQIIRQTISTESDSILECSDGEEAVKAYTSFLPDFVLMDIHMKKMDGLKATNKILEKFPDARIIIITENDTSSFRSAAAKAGALTLISKENLILLKEYLHL
jgi:two-component system, NarL family, response regulator DegU